MERFLKRKNPPTDGQNPDGGASRGDGDENPDAGTSRRDGRVVATNTNHTSLCSSRVSRREVNFDELPYDPADRRRISDYIGQSLQDEIRSKYLIRGPFRPPPGFRYPEKIIAGHPRRFHHE